MPHFHIAVFVFRPNGNAIASYHLSFLALLVMHIASKTWCLAYGVHVSGIRRTRVWHKAYTCTAYARHLLFFAQHVGFAN